MKATCDLCFRHCALEEEQTGFCRARMNLGGAVVPMQPRSFAPMWSETNAPARLPVSSAGRPSGRMASVFPVLT